MKTVLVVQARLGSIRLPGKCLMSMAGKPMLQRVLERLEPLRVVCDDLVLAVPDYDFLGWIANVAEWICIRGPERDVLERFCRVADQTHADVMIRVTGDCPLIDPHVTYAVFKAFQKSRADYASNCFPRMVPDGLDTEVFTADALHIANGNTYDPADREHVTPYLWDTRRIHDFKTIVVGDEVLGRYRHMKWSVDTREEFDWAESIFRKWGDHVTAKELVARL